MLLRFADIEDNLYIFNFIFYINIHSMFCLVTRKLDKVSLIMDCSSFVQNLDTCFQQYSIGREWHEGVN